MHILTESALRAWAQTRMPQARAISIAAVDFGVGHHGAVGAAAGRPRVAGHVELEKIRALPHEQPADLAHLVCPVGDPGEGRRLEVGQMQLVFVAEPRR
jgi:hypothetical protein